MNNETIDDFLDTAEAEKSSRGLQLFRAGSLLCGIFEEEIATIARWRDPTPLPQSPKSVMGVVSIQGRMLTVLDLGRLVESSDSPAVTSPTDLIALRGDEQLALAVNAVGENISIEAGVLDSVPKPEGGLVLATIHHNAAEIRILSVQQLFSSAIQGRERRRRRF